MGNAIDTLDLRRNHNTTKLATTAFVNLGSSSRLSGSERKAKGNAIDTLDLRSDAAKAKAAAQDAKRLAKALKIPVVTVPFTSMLIDFQREQNLYVAQFKYGYPFTYVPRERIRLMGDLMTYFERGA